MAPYQVCITPLTVTPDSPAMQLAEKFYAELTAQGVEVILDDRDERPGVKFKDADLVGFPCALRWAKNRWPRAKWKSSPAVAPCRR